MMVMSFCVFLALCWTCCDAEAVSNDFLANYSPTPSHHIGISNKYYENSQHWELGLFMARDNTSSVVHP